MGVRGENPAQALQRVMSSPRGPLRSLATWQVAGFLLLGCVVIGLFLEGRSCRQARGNPLDIVRESSASQNYLSSSGNGELEFVSYTSSPLEEFFLEKLPEMNFETEYSPDENNTWLPPAAYCQFVNSYEKEIIHWLTKVEESKASGAMYFDDDMSRKIFSQYNFRYPCKHSNNDREVDGYCTFKAMIEPLAFSLRHPVALCNRTFPDQTMLLPNKQDSLMDQNYLFYASRQLTDHGPPEHTHVDLGALVRGYGATHFLLKEYEKQGIEFNRMLLWEAVPITGPQIFRTVPEQWYHAYQYFNVPVSTDVNSLKHPLQILKRAHPGTGFVAFKLDIDQNEIENTVAQTIIHWHDQYPFIKSGQFEFFFEQHVDLPMMREYWKTTATESGRKIGDSYDLFLKLRKLGIRAHGWV